MKTFFSDRTAPVSGDDVAAAAQRIAQQMSPDRAAFDRDPDYFMSCAQRSLAAAFPVGIPEAVSRRELLTVRRIHDAADALIMSRGFSPSRTPNIDPEPFLWEARWALEGALRLPSIPAYSIPVFQGIPTHTSKEESIV